MPPLLQVRDLTTRFNTDRGPVTAVDRVSLDIEAGETVSIVGESGSGKSVTALSIMRLIPSPPGHIDSGSAIFEGEDLFALRVRGDSMIDAHICDGDLVLVRKQESAQLNDIVVAMVDAEAGGEATVKRYQRDGERVVLKPEHPTMRPIVVDPREQPVRILGKVVGLLRGF